MTFRKIVFLASVFFCLHACSGGHSGSGSSLNSSQLSGKIVTERFNQLWGVDLPAGTFTQYQHVPWDDDVNYHNVASFTYSSKGYDDNGFILTVRGCLPENSFDSCIVLLDRNGQRESSFTVNGSTLGQAKLSRDGQYIAVAANYDNDTWLRLYRSTGEFVTENKLSELPLQTRIDWHPDGQLYVAQRNSRKIVYTEPYSTAVVGDLELPNDLEGSIEQFAISPDGSKIVYELERDLDDTAIPIVLDLQTFAQTRLARDEYSGEDEFGRWSITNPVWSPDGKWILVTYGGSTGSGDSHSSIPFGTLPFLFAIPSVGKDVPLAPYDPNIETTAQMVITNAVEVIQIASHNADRWVGQNGYFWLP